MRNVEQRPDLRSWKVKGRRDSKFALLRILLSEEGGDNCDQYASAGFVGEASQSEVRTKRD